jgi:hypothetical protein
MSKYGQPLRKPIRNKLEIILKGAELAGCNVQIRPHLVRQVFFCHGLVVGILPSDLWCAQALGIPDKIHIDVGNSHQRGKEQAMVSVDIGRIDLGR